MLRRSMLTAAAGAAAGAAAPLGLLTGCATYSEEMRPRDDARLQPRVRQALAGTFAAEKLFPSFDSPPYWACSTSSGDGLASLGCLDAQLMLGLLVSAGVDKHRDGRAVVDYRPVDMPQSLLVAHTLVSASVPAMRLLFQKAAHRTEFFGTMAKTPVIFSHQGSCAFASAHLSRNHIAASTYPVGRLTVYRGDDRYPDNLVVTLNYYPRGGTENWNSECLAHSERNYETILHKVKAALERPSSEGTYTRSDAEHLRRLDKPAFYDPGEHRHRNLAPLPCVVS